ncbi:hypothetical protein [Candidatus Neomicrothrix sp.]|jgi:hypothetical protein|uniref:hypothetical protein n=1 Tax=Candidatus Neomicrothrix sp. TaxID=2719034 RepID=UPI001B6CEC80|nr:hypothetical protein [Candidatus Microthrix sp.]MBP9051028.1 hypothetical protein [Ilumatobacteraceae bacterium]HMS49111.1 hypothetical protein [Candidatus Microthrix sp.]
MPIDIPNLDDRSYADLLADLQARIAVHTPEWTTPSASDPGYALLEMFAFLTDNLLYRSNRIPEANRKKFLSLLGVPTRPVGAATGLVAFTSKIRRDLDAAEELRAGNVVFRTVAPVNVLPIEALAVVKRRRDGIDAATRRHMERLHGSLVTSGKEALTFYDPVPIEDPVPGMPPPSVDLSDRNACIDASVWVALLAPKTSTFADAVKAIGGQTLQLGVAPSPTITERLLGAQLVAGGPTGGLIVEAMLPDVQAGQDPTVTVLQTTSDTVLEAPGVINVVLPRVDEIHPWLLDPIEDGVGDLPPLIAEAAIRGRVVMWLRLRLPDQTVAAERTTGPVPSPVISWVGINAALARQCERVTGELVAVGNGAPSQEVRTRFAPVLVDQGGAGALDPEVEVQDDSGAWAAWERVDDLAVLDASDTSFQLDPDIGTLRFGDGLRGRRPGLGAGIRVTYDHGGGLAGAVEVGDIKGGPTLPGGCKVCNPVRTWGAGASETTEEAERSIPAFLRHRDRLVTATDFRDITLQAPGADLARVDVLPLFRAEPPPGAPQEGWPGMVTVVVIPRTDRVSPEAPRPDRSTLDLVCRWLEPRRLVTTELHVRGPDYVRMWVSIGVTVQGGQIQDRVERAVRSEIERFLSPLEGGLRDWPGDRLALEEGGRWISGGWPLDTDVRVQDIEAAATRVPGVRNVEGVRLAVEGADGSRAEVPIARLRGLQLPWAIVFASVGDPVDPSARPPEPTNQVPVPIVPETC